MTRWLVVVLPPISEAEPFAQEIEAPVAALAVQKAAETGMEGSRCYACPVEHVSAFRIGIVAEPAPDVS